jgi:hypothetical protein
MEINHHIAKFVINWSFISNHHVIYMILHIKSIIDTWVQTMKNHHYSLKLISKINIIYNGWFVKIESMMSILIHNTLLMPKWWQSTLNWIIFTLCRVWIETSIKLEDHIGFQIDFLHQIYLHHKKWKYAQARTCHIPLPIAI